MSNRKIFIDCGGHKGGTIKTFKQTTYWEDGFEIFSFEAVPRLANKYQNKVVENETYFNKAVWIEDGTLDFFTDPKQNGEGGSVHSHKITGNLDKDNPITVDTIDFSKWFLENFDKDDYIILHMDIEGAEYEVLGKMLEDHSIDDVDILHIEFHQEKINYPIDDHKKLVRDLKEKTEFGKFKTRPEIKAARQAAKEEKRARQAEKEKEKVTNDD
jgi:FkbM family methyltransferase